MAGVWGGLRTGCIPHYNRIKVKDADIPRRQDVCSFISLWCPSTLHDMYWVWVTISWRNMGHQYGVYHLFKGKICWRTARQPGAVEQCAMLATSRRTRRVYLADVSDIYNIKKHLTLRAGVVTSSTTAIFTWKMCGKLKRRSQPTQK